MADEPLVITITDWEEAKEAYRQKDLRQALYDEGEVVMADVLVNLHGAEHRARRRAENRLFRRDTFMHYQDDLFPPIIEETLKPYIADGHAELVELGHQLMMNLAALTSGVDRPLGTPEETFHLYGYLMTFIEGATLAHYTGDKEAKKREIQQALEAWDGEFLGPSIQRRRTALAQAAAGEIGEEDVPRDVLTVLLRREEDLGLEHSAIRREIAFFLLAAAHTSATAFTRTMHHVFEWLDQHPEDRERVLTDRLFVQRCVHETIRLWPSSPVAMRWALDDLHLDTSDRDIPEGAKVVIDLLRVNRSTDVFGEDADRFNPTRGIPDGVAPWGQSFGGGMHICIGQDLAAGVLPHDDLAEDHLFGLVPVAVQSMIDHGARPDPDDPPERDANTARPYWGRYPVLFEQER
jgi:cytochrome P450